MSFQELLAYLAILRRRWWLVAITVIATIGTIGVVSYTRPPMYRARVSFMVVRPLLGDVSLYELRAPTSREALNYTRANFLEILRGSVVAWRTVEETGVKMRGSELQKQVSIQESKDSEMITLIVTARKPKEAALLANGLIETALKYYGELQATPATNSRQFIQQQLDIASEELRQAQQRLTQFQIENNIGSLDTEITSQQSLIRALRLQRDQAEAEGKLTEVATYERLIAQHERELQRLVSLNTEYVKLKAEVSRAQSVYNLLLDKLTEATLKENEILNTSFVQIVEPASPPRRPISPLSPKIVVVGAIASTVLGIALAFLLEYVEILRVEMGEEKIQEVPLA